MTDFLPPCVLSVNQFVQQQFFCTVLNAVHPAHPFQLVACFECFVNAFICIICGRSVSRYSWQAGIHSDKMFR